MHVFLLILSNIVAYCVILSNIACFPAHQSTEEKRLSQWYPISSSTLSTWHTGFYWLLSFANGTEMEEARKGSTLAVLKVKSQGGFGCLQERNVERALVAHWPQAHSQLKEAWSAYVSKHFAGLSAVRLPTPPRLLVVTCYSSGIAL